MSFQSNYGLISLEIARVRREDAGLYTVKISNPEGEASSSAQLEVDGKVKTRRPLANTSHTTIILLSGHSMSLMA